VTYCAGIPKGNEQDPGYSTRAWRALKQYLQDVSSAIAGLWTQLNAVLYSGYQAILNVIKQMPPEMLISLIKTLFELFVRRVPRTHTA
jgi:phage-related protein